MPGGAPRTTTSLSSTTFMEPDVASHTIVARKLLPSFTPPVPCLPLPFIPRIAASVPIASCAEPNASRHALTQSPRSVTDAAKSLLSLSRGGENVQVPKQKSTNKPKPKRKVVHANRTYPCPVPLCGRVYKQASSLRRHRKFHKRTVESPDKSSVSCNALVATEMQVKADAGQKIVVPDIADALVFPNEDNTVLQALAWPTWWDSRSSVLSDMGLNVDELLIPHLL